MKAARALAALAILFQALPAISAVISGRVLDPVGGPADGVTVDFLDKDTGATVPTPGNVTDLNGLYAATVPDGAFRVRYKPGSGVDWAALEEPLLIVAGDATRPDITLPQGYRVSGALYGSGGSPVDGASVYFYSPGGWTRTYANRNYTNPAGLFDIPVPCGVYDLVFWAPAATGDASLRIGPVTACAPTDVGPQFLPAGQVLQGTVSEAATGLPVAPADLDARDPATGMTLPVAGDDTDAAGAYRMILPAGTWNVVVNPPSGSRYFPKTVPGVQVSGTVTLDIALDSGVSLSGRVTAAADGSPVEDADLDAYDTATGVPLSLSGSRTDWNGRYSVAVPPGTWDLEYAPPAGLPLLPASFPGTPLTADTVLDVPLAAGVRVTGRLVSAVDGTPIAGVDTDLSDALGNEVATPGDDSGADGHFTLVVPPAPGYTFDADPADTWVAKRIAPVDATADPTDLGDIPLERGVEIRGRLLRASDRTPVTTGGIGYTHATLGAILVLHSYPDAGGNFHGWVPEGAYTISINPGGSPPLLPVQLAGKVAALPGPLDLGDILLADASAVTGTVVEQGSLAPIRLVDLDVRDSGGSLLYTPGDDTLNDGTFALRLPAGTHSFTFTPRPQDPYLEKVLSAPVVLPRTDLGTIELERGAWLRGRLLRVSGGQPVSGARVTAVDLVSGLRTQAPALSDGAGRFEVLVRPGPTFALEIRPDAASGLAPKRVEPFAVALPETDLGDILLDDGVLLTGTVRNPLGQPAPGLDFDLYLAGTSNLVYTPTDDTAPDGTYAIPLSPGTYDVVLDPPWGSNLGSERRDGVAVLASPTVLDIDLVWLLAGIAPVSGPTAGGTPVTVTGNRFVAGMNIRIGGASLQGLAILDPQTATGNTGIRPAGIVDVTATYPSGEFGILAAAFEYVPPPVPPVLRVARSGIDVVLTWNDTGGPTYVALRATDPRFVTGAVLCQGAITTCTHAGGAATGGLVFYSVE